MAQPAAPPLFEQLARGWRGYALIALIALCGALPGVTRMPVMDRDEARFVQASRQMVESGDFVRIRLQQQDRNKKPIGIYWLQAAAVELTAPLTGRTNAIWAYRIPSVLGAVLAAMAAFWAGTSLMPRRAAFLGAALFAASMLMGFEGMTAKTDAMLTGVTTLAMAALAALFVAPGVQRTRLPALLFWAAFGVGVLVKGPVTPIIATLTLSSLWLWRRDWAWMKPLLWWPGPLLAALIVAPWMIAIGAATHGGFFADAFGRDIAPKISGGQEGHAGLPGFHLALLSILIFPATFALPQAVRLGWRTLRTPRDAANNALIFLIAWALPSFVAFELLPTKLAHYALPLYPAIALLCGAAAFVAVRERWRITRMIGAGLFVAAGGAIIAVMALAASFMPGDAAADLRREIQASLFGAGVLAAAVIIVALFKQTFVRSGAAIAAALIFSFTLRGHLLPEARALHVSGEAVAALARARLTPTDARPLWVVGYREASLVFLLRTDIRMVSGADVGARAAPGDALLVEGRALPETEAALAARGLVFIRSGAPVSGLNYGNGRAVDLYVGAVATAPPP